MPGTASRPDWVNQAACAGLDPTMFDTGSDRHNAAAVSVCAVCPVRKRCRDWMLDAPGSYSPIGVIAGGWIWTNTKGVFEPDPDDVDQLPAILAAVRRRRARP